MTSQPKWEPVDSDTHDLLHLVATGPLAPPVADEEWEEYVRCLRYVAYNDGGFIAPNTLRPLLAGKIAPRRIGAFAHRALSQGLVRYNGEFQVSDDKQGRNGGKPMRCMEWTGDEL